MPVSAYNPNTSTRVATRNADGDVVRYTYDVFGNRTTMTTYRNESLGPSSGDLTTWRYDEASNCMTNKVYADGKGPRYGYTPDGRLSQRIWARGIVTDYSYDGWGSLTNTVYSDGTPTVTLLYDAMGRQTNAVDAAGVTTFRYDDSGSLTNETLIGVAGENTIIRHWDSFGRTAGYTLNNVRQTTIGYDAATGRIATMLTNGSDVPFAWSYFPGSDLKSSLAYPNGLTASWTYDANGQLLQVRNATPTDVISQYDYTYDAAGRRIEIARSGSAMSESRTDAYGYNVRGELTSATEQGGQPSSTAAFDHSYQYDNIGNRLTSMDLGCSRAYTSNGLNQYTDVAESPAANAPQGAVEEFEPLYDDDGNQTLVKTATGVWSVQYNGENRPVLWTRASDGSTMSMAFDRMGRRVLCHEMVGAAAGSVMTFAYEGYVCVARCSHGTNGASVIDRFVWDPAEPVATRPLAFCMADSAPQYYAHDGSKNVSELVSADGAVSAHYEYAPFGAVTYSAGSSAASNPYRFSSEYADSFLALVYYNYRHYEPLTGRWGQYDFYMESGGCNLYEYVYNSPLLMFDNKGREPISLIGLFILIMSNPSVANAPGPDDAVVYSAGPMGMVIDLMGGKIITASLSCCGRFLGYIRFKVAYFRAERLLRSSVMELKGKSVAVGAFDARTGQYVVTGSGPVMTESTDAMKILAEKAGGLGVVKNGKCIGCCAEFHAADKLIKGGSIITDIRFTEAIRPRNELPIKMCENCLDMFKSNVKSGSIPVGMPTVMFLPGTSRLVDGWLNGNN